MIDTSAPAPLRILLVDDNAPFLRALEGLLETDCRFAVVGCAHSGLEALTLAMELAPDIALVDFDMPRMTGFEAIARLKEAAPAVRAVMLSAHLGREYAQRAVLAGADGFIAKDRVTEDLVPLLEQLAGRAIAIQRVRAVLESLRRASRRGAAAEALESSAAEQSPEYHDVRQSLERITVLAQLLIMNRPRLGDEDRQLLEDMVASSRRMHWLIDSVAVYDRLFGAS